MEILPEMLPLSTPLLPRRRSPILLPTSNSGSAGSGDSEDDNIDDAEEDKDDIVARHTITPAFHSEQRKRTLVSSLEVKLEEMTAERDEWKARCLRLEGRLVVLKEMIVNGKSAEQ